MIQERLVSDVVRLRDNESRVDVFLPGEFVCETFTTLDPHTFFPKRTPTGVLGVVISVGWIATGIDDVVAATVLWSKK